MIELSAEDLTAIWAVKKFHSGYIMDDEVEKIYEHLFECPIKFSDVKFGTGSGGGCETCYYEYPAVQFKVYCECGQVKYGRQKHHWRGDDYLDIELYDNDQDLSMILNGMLELKEEFNEWSNK